MTIRSRTVTLGPSRWALAGLLTLSLCAAVSAQDIPVTARALPPHRVGLFSISPGLELRDIGVDSNVFNTVDNPVSDVTFTVAPTVDATARLRRATVSLQSTTDLVYFVHQSSERSLNETLSASAQYPMRRITFGGSAGYVNTRERPDEEIDARSRRIDSNLLGSMTMAIGPRLSAQVSLGSETTRFDIDAAFRGILLSDTLNRTTSTLRGSVHYALTPLTTLFAAAESQGMTFERSAERNADSHKFLAGVELHPRAIVSGTASLGHQAFTPRSGPMPPFGGFVGNGSVMLRLRSTTEIGFSYDRNLYYSYWDVAPYYIRSGFGVLLRREVASQWQVEISTGRFHHHYRYLMTVEPSAVADQTVLDSGLAATYRAGPRTHFVIGLKYQRRTVTAALPGYSGVRFGSSVVYDF
jgi:hypothetical protein